MNRSELKNGIRNGWNQHSTYELLWTFVYFMLMLHLSKPYTMYILTSLPSFERAQPPNTWFMLFQASGVTFLTSGNHATGLRDGKIGMGLLHQPKQHRVFWGHPMFFRKKMPALLASQWLRHALRASSSLCVRPASNSAREVEVGGQDVFVQFVWQDGSIDPRGC